MLELRTRNGKGKSESIAIWRSCLKKMNITFFQNGDLIFSLGYLSSAERLTVVVMKARNLRHMEEGKITMGKNSI